MQQGAVIPSEPRLSRDAKAPPEASTGRALAGANGTRSPSDEHSSGARTSPHLQRLSRDPFREAASFLAPDRSVEDLPSSSSQVNGRPPPLIYEWIIFDLPGGEHVLTLLPQAQRKTPDELQRPQVVRHGPVHEPALPSQVTTCLGERLRAYYSPLMNEPLPEHFMRILEAQDETRSPNSDP
jgi:hypothetical protein